jgi:hypothetical protein
MKLNISENNKWLIIVIFIIFFLTTTYSKTSTEDDNDINYEYILNEQKKLNYQIKLQNAELDSLIKLEKNKEIYVEKNWSLLTFNKRYFK